MERKRALRFLFHKNLIVIDIIRAERVGSPDIENAIAASVKPANQIPQSI